MAIDESDLAAGAAPEVAPDVASVRPKHLTLARVFLGVFLLGLVADVVISFLNANLTGAGVFSEGPLSDLVFVGAFGMFPIIGYFLATRQPDNAIGWVMLGMGVFMGLPVASYGVYAINGGPGGRDLGLILEALDQPRWIPVVAIPATFLVLLFPDGHLPSPRWRWFARILGGGLVFIFLAILLDPAPIEGSSLPGAPNPLGVEFLRPFLSFALVSILIIPIGAHRVAVEPRAAVPPVDRHRAPAAAVARHGVWLRGRDVFVRDPALAQQRVVGGDDARLDVTCSRTLSILSFALIPIAIGVVDPPLPVVRDRRRDQPSPAVRCARRLHRGRVCGDRRGRRSDRRRAGQPFAVGGGCGGRRPRVPAGSATGAAVRRPARVREARDAVRGAVRVLRAGREYLCERGAAAEDGARARGGHRRREGGCMGARGRRTSARGGVAGRRRGNLAATRISRRGGGHRHGFVDVRAGPPPRRAARRTVDREAAGGVADRDGGEARPRPRRASGVGPAERAV